MTVRNPRMSPRVGARSSSRVQRQREQMKRRKLLLEKLEDRRVLAAGPQLAAVLPNAGAQLAPNMVLNTAPRELTFKFTNEVASAINPGSIGSGGANGNVRLVRANHDGVIGNSNDLVVVPGFIGLTESGQDIVMRFADPLPDDAYRIVVVGAGANPLRDLAGNPFNDGNNFQLNFTLNLGAKVVAVVPQPVFRQTNGVLSQGTNMIDVYFNEDKLDPTSAENVNFYQLLLTNNTVSPIDDVLTTPASAVYFPAQNRVRLTFAQNLASYNPNSQAFRLRIGTDEAIDPITYTPIVPATEPGTTFNTAHSVGELSGANSHVILQQSISARPYNIQWPGSNEDPGHRDNPLESEYHIDDGDGDFQNGTAVRFYNFKFSDPGWLVSDGLGGMQPSFNQITEAQRQRAREIFELYSRYSGIQFIESATQGITVATGDLRIADPNVPSEPGGVAGLGGGNLAIMDIAEDWNNNYGGNWFRVAMHEIGHCLGLGHTYDLPPLTVQGNDGDFGGAEGVFPGDHDIVHMRRLFRPEGQDIDMYQFSIAAGDSGLFTAETFAERLQTATTNNTLDTYLRLYRLGPDGPELIASNDDYFSKDSRIELRLDEGTYWIGVSAKGNENYDPNAPDSGMGGTSEGNYRLSVNFRPTVATNRSIVDATGVPLDGDGDGVAGGVFNFWFRTAATIAVGASHVGRTTPATLFVDRAYEGSAANGAITTPFKTIQAAINASIEGDIIRIVGNGGTDGLLSTPDDALAYEVGFHPEGTPNAGAAMRDGASLVVPKGRTVMIDAGAVFQMRRSRVQVGSTTLTTDRSGGALQVLGIPGREVVFTSFSDTTGQRISPTSEVAAAGDWGGLLFRNDQDRASGRFEWGDRGIFINYVNLADIRFGGGQVNLDGGGVSVITPIHMVDARPTVTNNLITRSADSAMSATPNSFEETNFREPRFQLKRDYSETFNIDYDRIGPQIQGNRLLNNTVNGLFVRTRTPAGSTVQELTVAGRFDDTDIVHIISENLIVRGTPSGGYLETAQPPVELVTINQSSGGNLAVGTYRYRVVNVDAFGSEGRASAQITINVTAAGSSVTLAQLPTLAGDSPFVARRIYRQTGATSSDWTFVGQAAATDTTFVDRGAPLNFVRTISDALITSNSVLRPRVDASLRIDPNIVVKLDAARIEVGMGATLIAEGLAGQHVIFTSLADDTYGAGGTFDTRNDGGNIAPARGQWSGIYAAPNSRISLDHVQILWGGGVSRVEGSFGSFNPVEIHQADARISNVLFRENFDGTGGAVADRGGRGTNAIASIFVRGAQPVIVNNTIRENRGPAINVNVNSLNHFLVTDFGRQTGGIDRLAGFVDNRGPLVRGNRLESNGTGIGNTSPGNGMLVRGGVLTTEGVWDDTDIVHMLTSEVHVTDLHTYGGLRLQSSARESLVVKAAGANAGFRAAGRPLEMTDRIGGMLHVIGQPGFPVVLTSLSDDSVGAGLRPNGTPQNNTNNTANPSQGAPGQWRGILIDKYAHDRNVDTVVEREERITGTTDPNDSPFRSQYVGHLAPHEKAGDENRRLGFTIHGSIQVPSDVDVYSFKAEGGTQVWLDIDRTSSALDSVVELIDETGQVLARSVNSHTNSGLTGLGMGMQLLAPFNGRDHYTTNVRDAGMRLVLPGPLGITSEYFIRVRSNSGNLSNVQGGVTHGAYQLQLRLRELDEFGGTVVRYADIRNAINGIDVKGMPIHSPLAGEQAEDTSTPNNTRDSAQFLGNLLTSDRGTISIAGDLAGAGDVDWYRFELNLDKIQGRGSPQQMLYSMVFDLDYANGLGRANAVINVFNEDGRLILTNRNSNVADDQALPQPRNAQDTYFNTRDLSRGSVGTADPFIGPVYMPMGVASGGSAFPAGGTRTYFVAVSTDARVPVQYEQFFTPLPANPLVRFQPLDSVKRIVEDHFDSRGNNGTRGTSDRADVTVFIDNDSAVPFHLGDVTLYVNTRNNFGTFNTSFLHAADPFTGAVEYTVGSQPGHVIEDIAFRADQQLFGFGQGLEKGLITDANSGRFLNISTANGAATDMGNTTIVTFERELDANGDVVLEVSHNLGTQANPNRVGWGVQFEALLFADLANNDGVEELIAVGNRGEHYVNATTSADPFRNMVYLFDTSNGNHRSPGGPVAFGDPTQWRGALTSAFEIGRIDTDLFVPDDPNDPTGPGTFGGLRGDVTGLARLNNVTYAVDDQGGLYTVTMNINAHLNAPGDSVTKIRQVQTQYVAESRHELAGLNFQALTHGPASVEGGRYADLLFGVTGGGRMYAFDTQGRLQPVFANGATSIQLGTTNVRGIAFGNLERNLWGQTGARGLDQGHGSPVTHNLSVQNINAVFSPNETTEANPFGPANQSYGFNNYNFNGGAYGTSISNEFSLAGYSAADQPVLYFTYFLNAEEGHDPNNGNKIRDSVRVFIAGNDGNWQLLGGNQQERFTANVQNKDDSLVVGTRLFEYQVAAEGSWRQTRVDLGDYAGQSNLRLRFDFSTAADMNLGDSDTTGSELRAVAGEFLLDGETFVINTNRFNRGNNGNSNTGTDLTFELDSSFTIIAAPAAEITHGDTLTVTFNGQTRVFEFDRGTGPVSNVPIPVVGNETATQMAARIRTAISGQFAGTLALINQAYLGDNQLNLWFLNDPSDDVTFVSANPLGVSVIGDNGVTGNNVRIPFHRGMTRDEIAQQIEAVLEPSLTPETLVVRGIADITEPSDARIDNGDFFRLNIDDGSSTDTYTFTFVYGGTTAAAPGGAIIGIPNGATQQQIAQQIRTGINLALTGPAGNTGRAAQWTSADQARVKLQGYRDEVYTMTVADKSRADLPIFLEAAVDVVKTHKDLIRIINDTVEDHGPLGRTGFTTFGGNFVERLQGDTGGFNSNIRGQNNNFEGIYIDDIVIGLAERGEMVTGADENSNFIVNQMLQPGQNTQGSYQLELRRGVEYDFKSNFVAFPGRPQSVVTLDSNDRLNQSVSIDVPAGAFIADGSSFVLTDGVNSIRFEFDVVGGLGSPGVTQGSIRVPFSASDTAADVAKAIRTAINSSPVQAVFVDVMAQLADGSRQGIDDASTSARVNIIGTAHVTNVTVPGISVNTPDRRYGDGNLFRDQGQLILEGNRISNSSQWGILVEGDRDTAGDGAAPHQGPTRALRATTSELVPGPVIVNNIISGNGLGGIRFAGSPNVGGAATGAIPFGRIVNNTIFGRGGNLLPQGGNDTGIQVADRAGPTLLNNIVANFTVGISVDGSSQPYTVIGGTVYQGNSTATQGLGVGAGAELLTNGEPLFVSAATGNFYLAAGSKAIDSAIDSLLDRTNMVTVREPLGIPPSPILAPDRDALGLLRVDDPSVTGGGSGENVFKDRGALDRADFVGPTARLSRPLDNGQGDADPQLGRVVLGNVSLGAFEIDLLDAGLGIDPNTVVPQAIQVEDTGGAGGAFRVLTLGTHYTFSFDATNSRIIITPTTGVWTLGRDYRITLDRSVTDSTPTVAIRDLAGNLLQPNRQDGTSTFVISLGNLLDWGDAPSTYPVTAAQNGASHLIQNGLMLGTNISADLDGQPSANADADTFDDGLISYAFSPGVESTMTVLAQGTGILDAWLDWNFNGVWEASEKLTFINGAQIGNNVPRTLRFTFGTQGSPQGDTFLRLRYSSAGVSTPFGPAADGEVEDYRVVIAQPQYQNPDNPYDVVPNGVVNQQDALAIINLLRIYDTDGTGFNPNEVNLPASELPPNRYYDVNGDGIISRADALAVVNFLSNPPTTTTFASSSVVYSSTASGGDSEDSVDDFFSQY
jgi:hypothetical protein